MAAEQVERALQLVLALILQRRFVAQWPPDSDAHRSYFERITRGPAYGIEDALRSDDAPTPQLNAVALTESTP